jgi:hypothetical protein
MDLKDKIASAYEAAIASGVEDSTAVERALATWRMHHPNVSDYDIRTSVAQIIAERRAKMREDGKLRGGFQSNRTVADKEE